MSSMRTRHRTIAAALALAATVPTGMLRAQQGHEHGAPRRPQPATPAQQPGAKPAAKPKPDTSKTTAKPVAKPVAKSRDAARRPVADSARRTSSTAAPRRTAADSGTTHPASAPHHEPPVPSPVVEHPTIILGAAAASNLVTALTRLAEANQKSHEHEAPSDIAAAPATSPARAPEPHAMWMHDFGAGWRVMGMAQLFPAMTAASPNNERSLLSTAGIYATQPVLMLNVASPGARFVLRTTLDVEELTQENGELTYGAWGEGFIDARHPHTLLHEAMLTANLWNVAGGALSLSAGKGFAPYGTDDPMGRPALKYPTNHHLSQVLERFTVNGAWLWNGWGLEAGIFGGAEPEDAYDLSNIESFGDSWSARLSRRFGGFGPSAEWELSGSFARVAEEHHGREETTALANAAVRHARAHGFGRLYALVEGSRSDPERGRGHWAVLGETQLSAGHAWRHQPYARVEYATRPEYERLGEPGTPEFFRYDHGAHETGATRWLISTVGYGYETSGLPVSVRPFVELQHHHVRAERGDVDPRAMYGGRSFWSVSAGARLFFGGGPMRMGGYGALDPMTAAMRPTAATPHHAH